jgi:hypothetical protein
MTIKVLSDFALGKGGHFGSELKDRILIEYCSMVIARFDGEKGRNMFSDDDQT